MPQIIHREISATIYDPDYIKGLFHSMSISYDRMNYLASFGFSTRWRYQFLKKITLPQNDPEILDLMTGIGETWPFIKKRFPDSKLTALDFCEGMIAKAKKKNTGKYNSNITLLQEDILNSKLESDSFDAVVCCFGLKTFNEKQMAQLAQEVKRILRPGGQFSFIEISVPANAFLKVLYRLYLKHIIPLVGRLMLGDPREYRMLWEYTSRFINTDKTTQIFSDAGLQAQHDRYFFGCASGISGFKCA